MLPAVQRIDRRRSQELTNRPKGLEMTEPFTPREIRAEALLGKLNSLISRPDAVLDAPAPVSTPTDRLIISTARQSGKTALLRAAVADLGPVEFRADADADLGISTRVEMKHSRRLGPHWVLTAHRPAWMDSESAHAIRELWASLDALAPIEAEAFAVDPTFGPLLRAAHLPPVVARAHSDALPSSDNDETRTV